MSLEHIDSIKDPRVIHARLLATTQGRITHQQALLESKDAILWALKSTGAIVHHVFMHDKNQDKIFLELLQKHAIPVYTISEGIAKKITDTTYLIPWIGVSTYTKNYSITHYPQAPSSFILILDKLQDPGNIGTLVRTAAAFGINYCALTTSTTDLLNPKVITASRGTIFNCTTLRGTSEQESITALHSMGYYIVATSPRAPQLQSLSTLPDKPIALIVGNETHGSSDYVLSHADLVVQIPLAPQVESLNVAIAGALSMYELHIKQLLVQLISRIQAMLGRHLWITAKLMRSLFSKILQEASVFTDQEAILLMKLACEEPMPLEQVHHECALTSNQNVNTFLEPLLQADYISKEERDKKIFITITQAGKTALAAILPLQQKAQELALKDFSVEERTQLNDFLLRIQKNCYDQGITFTE